MSLLDRPILIAAALYALTTPVYLIGHVVYARWRRVKVDSFQLWFGRTVVRFWVGRLLVRVGWLPLGGGVKFAARTNAAFAGDPSDDPDDSDPRNRPAAPRPGERGYEEIRVWERLLLLLAAPAGALLVSATLLGVSEAWRAFVTGFPQHLTIALAPRTDGAELLRGYFRLIDQQPLRVAVGLMIAKVTCHNMLPMVGVTTGGLILADLGYGAMGRRPGGRLFMILSLISLLLLLALAGSLAVAFWTAARSWR